jgi:hypothetical protein
LIESNNDISVLTQDEIQKRLWDFSNMISIIKFRLLNSDK